MHSIIQLVEADLNFIRHIMWGNQMIRYAKKFSALNPAQYAFPGQNNVVLNKILFLDVSWQTLSPGILIDYDGKVAFDRVLMSIITCKQMGLLQITSLFMFQLSKHMNFHLITGLGKSPSKMMTITKLVKVCYKEVALLPPFIL